MPPRYAYWTILAGGLPTAFRAADRDELMPTFQRLREKHPDAEMKWFARGRLWDSPEQAREESARRRERPSHRETRTADWRPGGTHRDPRQPFKDAKRARNIERRRTRFERKHGDTPVEKPHGDKLLRPPKRPQQHPPGDRRAPQSRFEPRGQRSDVGRKPAGQRREWREDRRDWRTRERPPREKPHGDPLLHPPRRENRSQRERPAPASKRDENVGAKSRRPFRPSGGFERNQGPDKPAAPPRPAHVDPNPEPRPGAQQAPSPPPRPSEPAVLPPGPPERGRAGEHKGRRDGRRR